jgi:heptaprenyl diphosphate synthase
MPLHDNESKTCDSTRKATLLLLAVAFNALELFLPRLPFLPWLKPGLANCITIIWLTQYGIKDALLFTILRSWISGFYFGFSFIALSLSLGGGILSTIAMGLVWKISRRWNLFGTVGLGITGAIFHNIAQLFIVYLLFTRNGSIFYQLPFMGAASILFGGIVGILAPPLFRVFNEIKLQTSAQNQQQSIIVKPLFSALSILILLFCISLFLISNLTVIALVAVFVSIAVSIFLRSFKPLCYPLKFWPLFLFILFIYFGFSYGTKFRSIPFLTHDGVQAASLQILRVWIWLEAGLLLQKCKFQETFFSILRRVFKDQQTTLNAGIIALEYFPDILNYAKSKKSIDGLNFIKTPGKSIIQYFTLMQEYINDLMSIEKKEN